MCAREASNNSTNNIKYDYMKEKSPIEKKAQEKQTDLLSKALSEASNAGGHWLNASGKKFPRLYPQGVSASPFNALFMALHSDRYGCKTNLFTLYTDAKARGTAVREHEQGVPFLFYNWNKYVNRNNPEAVPMTVRVTKNGNDITKVEILEFWDTPGFSDRAVDQTIAQIVERDTAIVDVVSGATMTSVGIMSAVSDALAQAK